MSARHLRAGDLAPLIAIALNGALSIPLGRALNMWTDEAYTVHTTSGTLTQTLSRAMLFELQPPLYFAILNVWRHLDGSYFFARFFSTVCIWLAIWASAALLQRLVPRLNALWVLVAIAVNPFSVWAAVEMRPYALIILFSALMLVLFYDGYVRADTRPRSQRLYIAAATCALNTQYYLLLVMVANAGTLLMLRRRERLKRYGAHALAVLALASPLLFFIKQQLPIAQANGDQHATVLTNVHLTIVGLLHFLFPVESIAHAYSFPLIAAGLALLLFLAVRPSDEDRGPALFALATALIVAACVCGASTVSKQVLAQRYLAGAFIPLVVATYAILARAKPRRVKAILLAWTLATLAVFSVSLATTYRPMAKAGDWQRAADFIAGREAPGQPVLVFWANAALPFSYYYRGRNPVVPLPAAPNLETYELRRSVIHDQQQLAAAIAAVPGNHPVLWLITSEYCGTKTIDLHCQLLERFIESRYSVKLKKDFFHSTVRQLMRK